MKMSTLLAAENQKLTTFIRRRAFSERSRQLAVWKRQLSAMFFSTWKQTVSFVGCPVTYLRVQATDPRDRPRLHRVYAYEIKTILPHRTRKQKAKFSPAVPHKEKGFC
ncbi:MAG: hypothetical protein ACLTBZ_12760 [Faecalispora jeddahensis]|uniref:hypothetical protein n=1 Tax=Faecalispora jeddahensis TaxID=1414721 RepID=UPI00399569EC